MTAAPISQLGTLHGEMGRGADRRRPRAPGRALPRPGAWGTVAIVRAGLPTSPSRAPRDDTGSRRAAASLRRPAPGPREPATGARRPGARAAGAQRAASPSGWWLLLDVGARPTPPCDVLHLAATSTVVALALDAAPEDRRRAGERSARGPARRRRQKGRRVARLAPTAPAPTCRAGAIAACAPHVSGYGHRVKAALLNLSFPDRARPLSRGDARRRASCPAPDTEAALARVARLEPLTILALAPFEPEPLTRRLARCVRPRSPQRVLYARRPGDGPGCVADGTYRLLLRLASDHPAELRTVPRGDGRGDRRLRRRARPPRDPRDARCVPGQRLQHERDRNVRSSPTATRSPTGSSACTS